MSVNDADMSGFLGSSFLTDNLGVLVLSDLLAWGRKATTNQMPMLRVLRELPAEAFAAHVGAGREALVRLQQVLLNQAPLLVDVVSVFLNEGGSAELRIEALEVAKNWTSNGLLSAKLVAGKILQPVMNYLVPYQQQKQQLNPQVVIPLVLEVVATCLVIPDMKELPQCIVAMFEWIGTRLSSWIVAMCTGVSPEVTTEKDSFGSSAERQKAALLKKLLGVVQDSMTEFIDEISHGHAVGGGEDPQLQAAFVNLVSTVATALADTRLTVSATVVESLLLFFKRVSDVMHKNGKCWVWRVQDGKWFVGVLQNVFRALVNNNTFRFETNDLTFFYSEAASASTYREEIQDYRQKSKTPDLLLIAHELLAQVDVQQKHATLWTVSFLCQDIERVAQVLLNTAVEKKDRNLALRRLEACVWAFSELHTDQSVRTRCTVQILATMRLLCQIPFNTVLTTTSARFVSRYKDSLDAGTLEDVRAVVSFILNQCIAGGENDYTIKNWDFRLVLTQTLREVAMCRSSKVMEVLRSQGVLPMAQFADSRLKPPKMTLNDTKVDVDHYGIKGDTDAECEHATLALRLRGRLAQGFVQLAVEKGSNNGPGGLVAGGHNLVRWVVYPLLAQLDKWIGSGNRAFLNGISGELYVLHMAMLPLQYCCSLASVPGEAKGPPITMAQFPGVPPTDKPLLPELCFAIIAMTRSINKKHMTSPNIVRHLLKLFERITLVCLRDITQIPDMGKKLLAHVVELTSVLYANASAGQELAFTLLKRITTALLGINHKDMSTKEKLESEPGGRDKIGQQAMVRYNLPDMPERMLFVYQIAAGMCLIGELCAQALPKVKPHVKVVPMGSVAVARLRFYFEFLGHIISVCPQLFYFGLPQQAQQQPQKPLLDRCVMVLSIVLLSADKKPLLKAALNVFMKLATETRREFVPVVSNMLADKLPSLFPPMFFIVMKIANQEIEDDADSKSTILMQTAQVMLEVSRNYHQIFINGMTGAVRQMLTGSANAQDMGAKWVHLFAESKEPHTIKRHILDFIRSFFS